MAKEGSDVSIIAYGGTVPLALKAAEQLEKMESKLKLLTLELLLLLTSHQSVKQLKKLDVLLLFKKLNVPLVLRQM